MATFSTVGICNKALVLCGASPITALTDDSVNARALNEIIEESRQEFLTECRWTFALTRSSLTSVATATIAWRYDEEGYAYTRPTGCLQLWDVYPVGAMWRMETHHIISDNANLKALWTYDQTDYSVWHPQAIKAYIYKLASEIAYGIMNSVTKAESLTKLYEKVHLPKAMAASSQTGTHQQVIDDAWTGAKDSQSGDPSRSYS